MKIPRDKQLHLVAGALGGIGIIALSVLTMIFSLAVAVFAGVTAIAAAKEGLDKWLHNGTPDWEDFLFTVAGGAVIALLIWAFS